MPKFIVDGDTPINKVRNGDTSNSENIKSNQEEVNQDDLIGRFSS